MLKATGQPTEARRRLEHSLTLDPSMFLAHQVLGDLLCDVGEFDAAVAQYGEALRLRPDFKAAEQSLSVARSLAGR
ncbi:MAG: hypothetical protein H0X40_19805 [Chthoniobacterales bacterium]|nr:hypothetical protein [Chthoniobacterales bacterium]